jgi:RNA polymerase sigma-70 factor (ECF subfamily)
VAESNKLGALEKGRRGGPDEVALVAALKAGDERAYALAWSEYGPMVRRLVGRFFGPGAEPLDLGQEVFVRFFRRIHELRSPDGVRGFLAGICLGVARNEARRMRVRRWVSLTSAGTLPDVAVSGADLEGREALRRLYAVLEQASALDRSLFVARFLEKMEVEEVARAHELSFGTTKRRLARAVARLNRIMQRDDALVAYLDGARPNEELVAGRRDRLGSKGSGTVSGGSATPPPAADRAGEGRLGRAAELLLEHEMLPGPAPLPDFARLLSERTRWQWRRVALGMAGAAALVALAVGVALKERAPLSYVVAGEAAIAGTRIEAPRTGEETRIRFSEGTEVTLASAAEIDVVERTRRGALLSLERGQARFSVVHRWGARWTVVAGPFAIEVTGTEFTVDWAPEAGRMVVDLRAGAVRVRGASVGGAVELHAGERLVATAADHRVTLSPTRDGRSLGAERIATDGARGAAGLNVVASPSVASTFAAATATATSVGAASPSEGTGAVSPLQPPPSLAAPSRLVVDGSGRDPARQREVAVWSPREGARLDLPEQRVPSLEAPGLSSRIPALEGPRLDPSATPAVPTVPVVPQSLTLGGGGLFCVTEPAQYTFEQPVLGLGVPALFTLAFANPRVDRSHSWCGESSVRVDASFDDSGSQNFFGRYPKETGQLLVKLEHPVDLTGRTVTMHFFVEGPSDARFSAELAVVHHGRWVSNHPLLGLSPGRWWTVSHRFGSENVSGIRGSSNPWPYPNGGTSPVSEVDRLALAIHSTGELRIWKGAVFVDDIAWK